MKLVKTSIYISISTAVTFISGFIITKVVAVQIGPVGITYVGQYLNVLAILGMISTLAITSGVVKYLAEFKDDTERKQQVISTALAIVVASSAFIAALVFLFYERLSLAIFHTANFADVFFFYGFFVIVIAVNTLMLAVYNGLKQIRQLTIINITTSVAGICFTLWLARYYGIKGVLVANNFTAVVVLAVNLFILRRQKFFGFKFSVKRFDKRTANALYAFTIMGVMSGFVMPTSQLIVRNMLITTFSAEEAGLWQGVTKISDYYLAFISTVLSVYYLPRLSEIVHKKELRAEIAKGYKLILPAVGFIALFIWITRDIIIHLLFSPAFLPMRNLFTFQLLGDFFKVASLLMAYLLLAKANVKLFILSEALFGISFIALSYFFVHRFGIIGATYAFCATYGWYWIAMYFFTRKYWREDSKTML